MYFKIPTQVIIISKVYHAYACVTVFMAALRSICGHYIFLLFLLLLSSFPRLISAVSQWMSAILAHML